MRLVSYNVEWFTNLFDDYNSLLNDNELSGRRDVTRSEQLAALSFVFNALDADAVMVIEAPDDNTKRSSTFALETFAEHAGIRARKALIGFSNNTQQEIALLYDPDKITATHDPMASEQSRYAPRFDDEFHIDLDIDAQKDRVTFSKPPLELAVTTATGISLRLIGAHLKSKAPHGAKSKNAVMRAAIANRRKQLAQAVWLRRRIDMHLKANEPLIVMGDLNDGPGLDEFEELFGRSSVEVVLGQGDVALYDPHAETILKNRFGQGPSSARFHLPDQGRYLEALLDYAMISPDLRTCDPNWRIWHPFADTECWADADLRNALLTASDHFPVVLDIAI